MNADKNKVLSAFIRVYQRPKCFSGDAMMAKRHPVIIEPTSA
jgi:hypothetical protein